MSKCIVCNADEKSPLYEGIIRSGSYGKFTEEKHMVVKCENCGLAHLDPFPEVNYDTEEYRENYNDTSEISSYVSMHDHEQTPRIAKIGIEQFRDKVVADLGCGGGSFLDAISGFVKKTIGIEPFTGYHSSLKERGHEVYASTQAARSQLKEGIDVVVSFGVIEHTSDPVEYLKDSYSLLKKNGTLFLETDNLDDFLMKLKVPEFEQFFYRTAHYWYFERNSLKQILDVCGFRKVKEGFRHGYDLSNAFLWMKDRKPTGMGKIKEISPFCNDSWQRYLEESGQAELLYFKAIK